MCDKPWWLFFPILLVVALYSPSRADEPIPPKGVVTGAVIDAVTREPLAGANVSLGGTTIGAVSDSAGRFRLVGVPSGTYQLRVALLGYQNAVLTDIVVTGRSPADVVVRLVESPIELEGASVTAGYFVKSPDAPVSTRSQSNEEIRRLPGGFEDVVRAVSILPGVAQAEGGRNDLIVRGGAPSENLFLVDNLEVFNINHFGTQGSSGGPLSFINLDFVRQTTFSSGGFGARYGDRLSSVLAIDLRDGRRDRVGGKAVISASQFGANLEGPLGANGSFLASARRSYLDFIFKAAKLAFVPQYWDFFAKASLTLGPNDRLGILAIGALDDVKLFGETAEDRYDNSRILYSDQDIALGGLTWTHTFDAGYALLSAGRSYVDYDYRQRDTTETTIFSNRSIETESSLRLDVVTHLAKRTELSVGAQVRSAGIRSAIVLPGFWTNFGDSLSADRRFDTTGLKAALYAQLSEQLGRLRVTVGARADYFALLQHDAVVAPRLSLSYALDERTTVNASGGVYYQAPAMVWLAANPANASLRFVRANQAVLGVDRLVGDDATVSVEVYSKAYRDYPASLTQRFLVLANTGAGFGGSQESYASFGIDPLVSAGTGHARGVELLFQKKLSETPWYGLASLSFNEARFTPLDGVERPGAFDQRWIVNLGGGYVFDGRWEASMKFRLATGRPYTPYNADGTQDPARVYAARIGTNHSLDVRVDRRWSFEDWNLIAYIDIQNLYNRKPSRIPTYNERTGMLDEPRSIGILPSIGVTAEF